MMDEVSPLLTFVHDVLLYDVEWLDGGDSSIHSGFGAGCREGRGGIEAECIAAGYAPGEGCVYIIMLVDQDHDWQSRPEWTDAGFEAECRRRAP